jgi:hypothetical protein
MKTVFYADKQTINKLRSGEFTTCWLSPSIEGIFTEKIKFALPKEKTKIEELLDTLTEVEKIEILNKLELKSTNKGDNTIED